MFGMVWTPRGGGAELCALLLMPRISDSLSFRAYLKVVGDEPFLRWWVRQFNRRNPETPLGLVCVTDRQTQEVRRAVARLRVRVIRAEAGTTLRCLATVAVKLNCKALAALPLGFVYGPADLLKRACVHHHNTGNDYTRVLGLPYDVAPEIFGTRLLARLAGLRLPGLPTSPGAAAEFVLQAAASVSEPPPVRILAEPLDADASYGATPSGLPEKIVIASPRDIRVARRVQACRGTQVGPLSELRCWRAAAETVTAQARRRIRRLARSPMSAAAPARAARKVLFVSAPSAFSGPEQSLVRLVNGLDHTRFEPYAIVGMEGLLAESLRQSGCRVFSPGWYKGGNVEDMSYVMEVLGRVDPDIVHLNAPPDPSLLWLASSRGLPVVMHVHLANTRAYISALKASEAVIATSEFVRGEILRLEVPGRAVHVIPNGIDTEAFRRDPALRTVLQQKYAIPALAKVVLMIGRMSPEKRHDVLIRAASLAKGHVPDLFLLLNGEVFGESPAYDSVLDLIRRQRMESWIRIIPFVKDIREMHSLADVLVLCSEREAFGCCVAEAMAMEVPVIVTNSGAIPEIVRHGKTGFIVPPGEDGPLARQIVSVLTKHELRSRVVREARHYVERKFDSRRVARKVMALYDRLLHS